MQKIKYVFFGTPSFAVTILEELEKMGLIPSLIVTQPDAPYGRGKNITPPPVKVWAQDRKIEFLQPEKIDEAFLEKIKKNEWDLFIVAAYGKLLPQALLDIPEHGTLNVHPSLLPRLRGPSPIRSAILQDEKETGVSIMLLDDKMDHGPLVTQEKIEIPEWPPDAMWLENSLAHAGGSLLSRTIPDWIAGNIEAREQNHEQTTYCSKLLKKDAEINLSGDAYENLLKIRGYGGDIGAYTFFERADKKIRVEIIDASLNQSGELKINSVKPEGKNEMSYEDFLRSGAHPIT